ncbi:uncharacterized protein LOC114305219 [Camellia sinensis]|uniref:uncharacterized protein LOC114305219 n=1 Tax=Camellia sinensis TaxID=4442 RepID=UPI0010363A35|nr:uncharacterized protein LOC114305219 [Camellia sinensis]
MHLNCSGRESTQQQQHVDQNNASMKLINSVTGTDEEGQSRQQILTFASRRYVRRIVCEGGLIVDPDQGEFLCPVGTMDLQIQHCLHYLEILKRFLDQQWFQLSVGHMLQANYPLQTGKLISFAFGKPGLFYIVLLMLLGGVKS